MKHTFSTFMLIMTVLLIAVLNPGNASAGIKDLNPLCNVHVKDSLLSYKDKSGRLMPVRNIADWQRKRLQILEGMQEAMGKIPDRKQLPAFDVQIVDSVVETDHTRYSITFTVAKNEILPADLYIPHGSGKPKKLPAVLALHGTSDLGRKSIGGAHKMPNRAYAKELAQRGYVVIAPDYPSFGDLKDHNFETDRYESGTMKAIFNHLRCVDLLQSRKDVDPERIGVIGHSLGGHNAIFAAAFDPRLKVVVSSCGWTLMDFYDIGEESSKKYGGRLGPWAQNRYMPLLKDKYGLKPADIPFDFDEVISALAPRPFFSNSPVGDKNFDFKGVGKGVSDIAKVYQLYGAGNQLQVSYPDAAHDFPPAVRLEAYRFIDQALGHVSKDAKLLF
jgi:pimeloyl-ACP methyl ester carboxylesterase